ncbi:DUF2922 domain-containing protein [uncultured Selenomonas sp.]|uniref:DUF2922 domain-containing protein n=1 Tax=uncultured Selenomonas sp. TaxID=159275 RepID=UPI0025E70D16|nr:DUF2922 domain-containing protein [uncultured Selenomonas sp.]
MAKVLKIVFDLKDDKTATYSLADPKDGLTKNEVQTATTAMLAKDFVLSGGTLATGVKDAYIQQNERIELA